jgi:predicted ABC-type ATPase
MLVRLNELAHRRTDFAFETTLASRSFAPWLKAQMEQGYEFHLVFLWLPSADMAVRRVRDRVRRGGHEVPEQTVRRRFHRGIRNFLEIYRGLANSWQVADNSGRFPKRIAHDERFDEPIIDHPELWDRFLASAKP